jgi:phospholipase D1/2
MFMPWNDTEPVQTYDDQTKIVLESISERVKNAGGKGQVRVALCESYASVNNAYFSHHQKQVVVDRKIAYVGGIDLAYGRMDDESYNLEPDSLGRQVLIDITPAFLLYKKIPETSPFLVDPDLMSAPWTSLG